MTIDENQQIANINQAIEAHKNWIKRFRASLDNANHEPFDLKKVRDDKACSLGCWLHSEPSKSLIAADTHSSIKTIHATFHELAYLVATMFSYSAPRQEIADLLSGLENVSNQLVDLLQMAKARAQ